MLLFLALLLPLQDAEFSEILKRFEADEPAVRDSASKDLDAFARRLGSRAPEYFKLKLATTQGEVRGRLQDQLNFLDRVENARNLLKPLAELGLPDLSKVRLVLYDSGWLGWSNDTQFSQCFVGWLMEESKEKVRLLSLDLESYVYDRKFEPPKNWEELKKTIPKGAPLPCEWIEIDFREACACFCSSERRPWNYYEHNLGPASGWTIQAAAMAAWALQRGQERTAFDLLEAADAAVRRERGDEKRPYSQVLISMVCSHLRHRTIVSAESRPLILKGWQTIQKLQPGYNEGEASKMISLYEQLITEDTEWKEPGPEDAARKNTAAYWVHHLRDVAARQMSDPGSCNILQSWGIEKSEKPYPPDELIKIGWDALPALIDHLDDPRPTRSVGWHRSFNTDSYYLLRVGDCCQQIFEAITGFDIYRARSTSSAMLKDGDAPSSKEKAKKWFEQNKAGGAEKYYLSSLDKPDRASFAATKLLDMDKDKHLPRLVALLGSSPKDVRNALAPVVAPHLSKDQEKLLDPLLKDPDIRVVYSITRTLWDRFGSDRGALELIARLRALPEEEKDVMFGMFLDSALEPIRTESLAAALVDLQKTKNPRVRWEALGLAGSFPHPMLAAALADQLEDRTLTGWSSGYPIRFCDRAAGALAGMAGLSERFALKGQEEERDRTIAALKSWWSTDGRSVDWKKLLADRKEAEQQRFHPAKK